jgi:hypothetical protein
VRHCVTFSDKRGASFFRVTPTLKTRVAHIFPLLVPMYPIWRSFILEASNVNVNVNLNYKKSLPSFSQKYDLFAFLSIRRPQ